MSQPLNNRIRVTEKISFALLQQCIAKHELHKLGRSDDQEAAFQDSKRDCTLKWRSMKDFILSVVLGFPYNIDESSGKRFVSSDTEERMMGPHKCFKLLKLNDFPYYFEDDVVHFLLWKLGLEDVTDADILDAVTDLKAKVVRGMAPGIPPGYEFVTFDYFNNPLYLKSVPEINHAHLLVQIRPRARTCLFPIQLVPDEEAKLVFDGEPKI